MPTNKLHGEKRIKAVDSASDGAPTAFEDGDIIYDTADGGGFKKKDGGIGAGTWGSIGGGGASILGDLTDVQPAADPADHEKYLRFSESVKGFKEITAASDNSVLRIQAEGNTPAGVASNQIAVVAAQGAAAAAAWNSNAPGTLNVTFDDGVTTLLAVANLINALPQFSTSFPTPAGNGVTLLSQWGGTFGGGSDVLWSAQNVAGSGSSFVSLSDTPGSFAGGAGDANKLVKVNGGGDGLEFSTIPLSTIEDVNGYTAADVGKRLEYSYVDPQKIINWTSATTLTVTMQKSGKRGAAGNAVVIDFIDENASAAGVASYSTSGAGTLSIKYDHGVTTALQMKTAIDLVADFVCVLTGTDGHTADNAQIGADTTFANGSERWEAKTVSGGGATDLGYTPASRELSSSTGNNVNLPLADTTNAGLMSDTQFDKLDGIEAAADVTNATNVNAAGAIMHSDVVTKGHIIVGDGAGDATMLAVGSNTHVLTADSNEASGVKWAVVSVSGGSSIALDSGVSETAVTITDTGADGNIEFKVDNTVCWNIGGHIIPATDNAFDIGSASYKVRDLYVSDNSLWVGDTHKISVSGGKMKFRKRKTSGAPAQILTYMDSGPDDNTRYADAAALLIGICKMLNAAPYNADPAYATDGTVTWAQIPLHHLVDFANKPRADVGGVDPGGLGQSNIQPHDIFRPGTPADWDEDFASDSANWAEIIGKPNIPASFGDLSDTIAPIGGDANKFVKVNVGGNGIVFVSETIPSGNAVIDWTQDQGGTNIHSGNYIGGTSAGSILVYATKGNNPSAVEISLGSSFDVLDNSLVATFNAPASGKVLVEAQVYVECQTAAIASDSVFLSLSTGNQGNYAAFVPGSGFTAVEKRIATNSHNTIDTPDVNVHMSWVLDSIGAGSKTLYLAAKSTGAGDYKIRYGSEYPDMLLKVTQL